MTLAPGALKRGSGSLFAGAAPTSLTSQYYHNPKNVKLAPGETVHFTPGKGYYAGKKGIGANGRPLPGVASAAPAAKSAAGKAAAVASGAPTAADLIAQYNIAKAKILESLGPQIQGIYSNANADLQGAVSPLTQDVRSRLFGAGQDASGDLGRQLGGLTQTLGTDVTPAFHPDETANAAYALGAAFPGESLAKQGAAFGAAASFLPAASLEQGQMALTKELQAEGVASSKASTISASVSKLLGYASDAQGNPIRDKRGKIIPIQTSGSGTSGKYHYIQPGDGFTYKYDPATNQTTRVGPGYTKNAPGTKGNHYQYKTPGDGFTYIFDPNTGTVKRIGPGPKKGGPKNPSKNMNASQVTALTKLVQSWHDGISVQGKPNPLKPGAPVQMIVKQKPISYQVALRRLMSKSGYHMTLQQAQEFLNGFWKPGENGRPFFDYQHRQLMLQNGYSKALLNAISTNPANYQKFLSLFPGGVVTEMTPALKAKLRAMGLPA